MSEAERSRGLGDTVAKAARALGLDRLAEGAAKAAGKADCGCKERQAALNRLMPYSTPPETTEAPAGPRPKAVLQKVLSNTEFRQRMCEQAAHICANYPVDATVVVPWITLQNAGITTYYHPELNGWVRRLLQQGMRLIPASMGEPEPGDLWIRLDAEKLPAECGLVVELNGAGELLSFDRRGDELHREPVRSIDYMLRLP